MQEAALVVTASIGDLLSSPRDLLVASGAIGVAFIGGLVAILNGFGGVLKLFGHDQIPVSWQNSFFGFLIKLSPERHNHPMRVRVAGALVWILAAIALGCSFLGWDIAAQYLLIGLLLAIAIRSWAHARFGYKPSEPPPANQGALDALRAQQTKLVGRVALLGDQLKQEERSAARLGSALSLHNQLALFVTNTSVFDIDRLVSEHGIIEARHQLDEAFRLLLDTFAMYASQVFSPDGQGIGVSILRPGLREPEILEIWADRDVRPRIAIDACRYYIGPTPTKDQRRGMAGKSYVDGSVEYVRISEAANRGKPGFKADNTAFVFQVSRYTDPGFRTLVTIPASGPRTRTVVSIDSKDITLFNHSPVQEQVNSLAQTLELMLTLKDIADTAITKADLAERQAEKIASLSSET